MRTGMSERELKAVWEGMLTPEQIITWLDDLMINLQGSADELNQSGSLKLTLTITALSAEQIRR